MPRQTSLQVTPATDRQVEDLQALGFGTFTDVVRLAIDRMHREETMEERNYAAMAAQIYREVYGIDNKPFYARKVGEIQDWLIDGDLDDTPDTERLIDEWQEWDDEYSEASGGDIHEVQENYWDGCVGQSPEEFMQFHSDIEAAVREYIENWPFEGRPAMVKVPWSGAFYTTEELLVGYLERHYAA